MQTEFCLVNVVDHTFDLQLSFPLLGRKHGMFHYGIYCKVGSLPNLTYSCFVFTILRFVLLSE